MTIAIAVSLSDAVFLVADGRMSNSFGVLTDKQMKISPLSSNAGLVVLGAEIGTEYAKERLKSIAGTDLRAEAFTVQLGELARESQSHVLKRVPLEQQANSIIRVGLVVGGFDAQGSFATGALFGVGMEKPSVALFRGELGRIVLGGEGVGAQAWFDERAQAVIGPIGVAARDLAIALPAFKQVALETVEFAAERDPSIGGTVRYAIYRRGQAPEFGRFLMR